KRDENSADLCLHLWKSDEVACATSSFIQTLRLLGESEDPQRPARRDGSEPWVAREQGVDAADADRHRDVLHAVLLPGHRLAFDARAGLELPQLVAGIGVERL